MLMKKSVLAFSVLALAISSESALAADVQFFGSVTDTTCDLVPHTDGAVNNLVQLGSAEIGKPGKIQNFSLKADASKQGCGTLSGKATIAWSGPFNEKGLAPQAGLATDAWTKIETVNAESTAVQSINSTQLSTDFDATKLTSDGAQYSAQLQGGTKPGDYRSAAAFVVTYN